MHVAPVDHPLRERNYRLFSAGQAVSMMDTWMQPTTTALLMLRRVIVSAVVSGWSIRRTPIIPTGEHGASRPRWTPG